MASLTTLIEVRKNPYSSDGQFGTPEKLAYLQEEYKRQKDLFDSYVRHGRMLPANRDRKLGAAEALIREMQERQLHHLPPELQAGPAVVVNFRSHADAAEFEETGPMKFAGICAIRPA